MFSYHLVNGSNRMLVKISLFFYNCLTNLLIFKGLVAAFSYDTVGRHNCNCNKVQFNLLEPELFFLILAHPVFKM